MAIESGDRVALAHVGHFEDGTVFNTSRYEVAVEYGLFGTQEKDRDDYTPQTSIIGTSQTIPGLDEAVVEMSADEETTVTVPSKDACGEFDLDQIQTYDAETFEGMVGKTPEVGSHVHAKNGLHGDVAAVHDDEVEIDFSHELTGKTLVFGTEVVAVQ